MSLDTVLDSIVAGLLLALPDPELKTCELAGGRIDLAEIRRRSTQLPGAFVACTGTRDGSLQFNKLHCRGYFLAVLAVQSRREGQPVTQDRAHGIARLTSRVMHAIASAGFWGNDEVTSKPADIASLNPYSKAADENNLALWGITWEQDLELVGASEPADLGPLTSVHTDWQMAESTQPVDAEDDQDMDGP